MEVDEERQKMLKISFFCLTGLCFKFKAHFCISRQYNVK